MTDRPNLSTAALVIAFFALFFWAQHDDTHRAAPALEALADQQDAEALSSREAAAQWVCGDRTPVWVDDKTLACLPEVEPPVQMVAALP